MLRLFLLVALIHVYMGLRLLPDMPFGLAGMVISGMLLVTPLCVLPFAEYARRHNKTRAPIIWPGQVSWRWDFSLHC